MVRSRGESISKVIADDVINYRYDPSFIHGFTDEKPSKSLQWTPCLPFWIFFLKKNLLSA